MLRLRFLAVAALVLFGLANAWSQETINPPSAGRAASVHDTGKRVYLTVRVTTNAKGRVVSAVIIQSSGSAILDRHCVKYAKENWSGPPNKTKNVPCYYKTLAPN